MRDALRRRRQRHCAANCQGEGSVSKKRSCKSPGNKFQVNKFPHPSTPRLPSISLIPTPPRPEALADPDSPESVVVFVSMVMTALLPIVSVSVTDAAPEILNTLPEDASVTSVVPSRPIPPAGGRGEAGE